MNKLIGFFALTGMAAAVVVGCTVDANPLDDITLPEAGSPTDDEDSGTTSRPDSGGRTDSGSDAGRTDSGRPDGGGGVACAAPAPASIPYNEPAAAQNVCTQADITELLRLFGGGAENPQYMFAAGCEDCVLGTRADAAWGPFLLGQNDVGFPANIGGCATRAGIPAACGKSLQNAEDCRFVVCEPCSANEADYDACLDDPSTETKCTAIVNAVDTACTEANLMAWTTACLGNGQFAQFAPLLIRSFCGPAN